MWLFLGYSTSSLHSKEELTTNYAVHDIKRKRLEINLGCSVEHRNLGYVVFIVDSFLDLSPGIAISIFRNIMLYHATFPLRN